MECATNQCAYAFISNQHGEGDVIDNGYSLSPLKLLDGQQTQLPISIWQSDLGCAYYKPMELGNTTPDGDHAIQEHKPWRQKKKLTENAPSDHEILIFEGKAAGYGPPSLEIASPEGGYLHIICKDNFQFLVPLNVVECFDCVDVILHSDAVFKEKLENVIRFPDIRAEIMESVLRFVFSEHLNTLKAAKYWGFNPPRLVFQFEVEPSQVMDLMYAAHFLGIKDLLAVTATMLARHLGDVVDVSTMPVDLAWCVAEQFSPQELYDAEERPDFLSLNLDTDVLWEKHCKKYFSEYIIKPISSASYASYEHWSTFEGLPPTSWKSLYIACELQRLADKQDGGSNDSFFLEVAYKGKDAYTHTVRCMFWDWVLSASASLSLFSYITHFPNLRSLQLATLPLGKPMRDGSLPFFHVGDILLALPALQHLDVSDTGFTTEAAVHLSKSIKHHEGLQVLHLANNAIKTEGFSAIVQALQYNKSLKYLDVRKNDISSSMKDYAVSAFQASAVQELLLDGNFNAKKCCVSHQRESTMPSAAKADELGKELVNVNASQQSTPTLSLPILSGLPGTLKQLRLSNCALRDPDVETLVQTLVHSNAIQVLDLNDNHLTALGAATIFTWLQDNTSLLELTLANNTITDSCSTVLIAAISSNITLQKLSLKGNYTYGEENLMELVDTAVGRGQFLLRTTSHKFSLDLRSTHVAHATSQRLQRQMFQFANFLNLLV